MPKEKVASNEQEWYALAKEEWKREMRFCDPDDVMSFEDWKGCYAGLTVFGWKVKSNISTGKVEIYPPGSFF
jgi:hypothetical protein